MPVALACPVCGYHVVDAKSHDIPAPRAARMYPVMTCRTCGKPARVRCANGRGTY